MILTCPDCASRYFVDDAKVGPDGRAVRCASCGHKWTAHLETPLELTTTPMGAMAVGSDAAVAETPSVSELPGEALPKVFREKASNEKRVREAAATGVIWAALTACLLVIVALGVVFRVEVVKLVPRTAGAFAAVGLPVNSVGLVIEQLRAEPSLQDGRAALTVSGVLRNIEDHAVTAPPLRVSLLNPAGKRVAGKIAAAADPLIPPGEARHFAIALLDPPSTAKDLEIGFVLDAGAAQAVKAAVHGPAPKAAEGPHLRGTAAPEAHGEPAATSAEEAHPPEADASAPAPAEHR
jgi:predicted Zn finger-like uncharacterized protein